MKVLLKQDVAGVGLKNEVKEVANGYAQNFLLPRGLAELATPARVRQAQQAAEKRAAQLEEERKALKEGLAKLQGEKLVIRATANEKDHLFEAVRTETIAAHLRDVAGVEVAASSIVIENPIKTLGEYTVHVHIGDERTPVRISVENSS